VLTYWKNLIRLASGDRFLFPRVAIFVLTGQCNFNCAYCEDFGHERNVEAGAPLPLADALRVLQILRQGTDSLILMGGEPLLYPEIQPLVEHARRVLRFRHLTLSTNGWLLPRAEALLPHIDRLVISLDSADPQQWSGIIRMPVEAAQAVLDNIRRYAARQKADRFRLILNAVLSPETLPGAPVLLDFCRQNRILISFSPQMVNNWPRYELSTSAEYKTFIRHLIHVKSRGGPIVGSMAYLKMLIALRPFSCYPTLTPRVLPNGDLAYPCRPIEKSGNTHGGRPCNLLEVASWTDAQAASLARFGEPPQVCNSCFQQCYAEPSLMQAQPLSLLGELLRYPASRRSALDRYAPG
jgi:MoaA/NifB/PqqE/SkfB family radical SAM enzyme